MEMNIAPQDRTWDPKGGFPHKQVAIIAILLLVGTLIAVIAYIFVLRSQFGAPSSFSATPGNLQITLAWTKPLGTTQVSISCKTTGYPAGPTDGELVYEGSGTSYIDKNLQYGNAYYYGIWAAKVTNGELVYSRTGKFASASPDWVGAAGEELDEHVYCGSAILIGADGHEIQLVNNPSANNPTWDQLKQFLLEDTTDQITYNASSFVCADFAEMLHNNAEKAGIRAAFVTIGFGTSQCDHAINAFDTTDKGLVYIDDTGTTSYSGCSDDKIVDVEVGQQYVPQSIFPCPGYSVTWENLGTVTSVHIEW